MVPVCQRMSLEPTAGADLTVLDVFADDAVDIVKLTPSHLALLGSERRSGRRIRQLILGGEDLTTAQPGLADTASATSSR